MAESHSAGQRRRYANAAANVEPRFWSHVRKTDTCWLRIRHDSGKYADVDRGMGNIAAMTYYRTWKSEFEVRTTRWRTDCGAGKTHKLDEHQQREIVVNGERRRLVRCWWCQTWVAANTVEDDMLDTWSAEAKAFWRSKHPR